MRSTPCWPAPSASKGSSSTPFAFWRMICTCRCYAVGTQEAHQALLTDQQLADRFAAFELPRWQDDAAFAQLLKTFASILPLQSPSDLCQPKIRQRILSLTEGVTVRICRVLEAAAIAAD